MVAVPIASPDDTARSRTGPAGAPAATSDRATLAVLAGDQRWSLAIAEIRAVLRPLPLTRVPHAPASLLGLANLRGAVLPVLSLSALLGRDCDDAQGSGTDPGTRIVVVDHKAARIGLLVDGVQSGCSVQTQPLDLAALLPASFALPSSSVSPRDGLPAALPAAMPDQAATVQRALLGFRIGPHAFALALEAVDAVSAASAPANPVPGTDAAMLGVLPMRGTVLPVLDGAVLLGLDRRMAACDEAPGTRTRLIVTRVAGRAAALAVDALTGILRVPPDAIEPVPPILFRGAAAEARVDAICRLENGRRLVQVLSADRLLDTDTMRRLAATARGDEAGEQTPDAAWQTTGHAVDDQDMTEPVLVFTLGDTRFGLPIVAVDEVLRHPGTLTRLPNAPAFVSGVTTLRGQVLPVIDQGHRFASALTQPPSRQRIVVARVGGLRVGLAVDSTAEVARFPASMLSEATPFSPDGVFDRAALPKDAGGPVLLVSASALLDGLQRDMLAATLARASLASTSLGAEPAS